MRYILLTIFCTFILTPLNTFARAHHSHPVGKTTLADTTEGNYDMKHIKFNLSFSDTSVYVSGDVTTTAQVTVLSMSNYVFELDTLMTIDSAKINGQLMTVQTNGIVRTINLPTPITQNSFFNAQIFYHGYSPTGGGFFNGLTHGVTSGGSNVVYSVSDPYAASDWWPCKQSLDDKIDSVDIWVTVPAGQVAGSNGLLKNIDSTSTPGYWQYQWKTRYAIDYYLISVAVGPYVIDSYRVLLPGATDSMLIQNFFLDTANFYPAYKANFDSINLILQYYCTIYGTYPYNQEKYGMCYTTLPGGMEHQTMTTIGVPYTWVIAHELCHQWFGDHVSYTHWGDVWLSEGFARYSEQLYEEHFFGETAAHNYRLPQYNNAMSQPGGSVYVTDTSGPNTLFDQRLVYDKGAAVVHMLRFLAPADSVFFNVLKTYQQQYAFGLATTEDLKNIAEAAYGMNLDTFSNQWIYGQGYPRYGVSWDQQGSTVYVKLAQTPSYPSSIPLFSTPLQVQLNSAAGDTVIRIYNNSLTQIYTFTWNDSVTSVKLEPNLWILCKVNTAVIHDPTLNTNNILANNNIKAFPNPTANNWQIEHLPSNTEMILTDMDGRVLWQKKAGGPTMLVPGKHLASGNYLLKIKYANNDTTTIQLTHW